MADCQICARLRTREGRETRCNSNTSTSSTAAAAYPRCSHGDSGTFIDAVWGFSASATERTAYSSGVADDKASALELALALHPSAAVGGTPTLKALELISELEGMDRGRYAGPVGWIDASGDGEFGIALRSAALDGNRVRLFARAGVVADSDPEAELAETAAKFVPVRDALGA